MSQYDSFGLKLNCFCYTGGFSLYALANGAEQVLSIDSSAEAIQAAQARCEAVHRAGLHRDICTPRRLARPA